MPKQGEHHKDGNDPDVSRGHNNPKKSTPITTGTYKKRSTYVKQEHEHKATDAQPQDHEPKWYAQTPKRLSKRDRFGKGRRNGSESNESTSTRGY